MASDFPTPSIPPPQPPFDRARFWRLLAQYFIGVAIGCLLVGAILQIKKRYAPPPPPPPSSAAPATPAGATPSEAVPTPESNTDGSPK